MYNNNIRTDSEIHQFINSEFRNDRLRLEWLGGESWKSLEKNVNVYILRKEFFSNIGFIEDKWLPNKNTLLHIYGLLNEKDQRGRGR